MFSKYADDTGLVTAIFREDDHDLYQREVDHVVKWSEENNLYLNAEKSVEIIYTMKQKSDFPKIVVDGKEINPTDNAKYLGLIFDDNLKFDIQMQTATKKSCRLLYYSIKLAKRCHSSVVITDFVDTFIISKLTYFLPVIQQFVLKKDSDRLHKLLRQLSRVCRRESKHFSTILELRCNKITQKLIDCFSSDTTHPLQSKFLKQTNPYNTMKNNIITKEETRYSKNTLSYISCLAPHYRLCKYKGLH